MLTLRLVNKALLHKVNLILELLAKQLDEKTISVWEEERKVITLNPTLSDDKKIKQIEQQRFAISKSIIKGRVLNSIQDMKNQLQVNEDYSINWGLLPISKMSIEQIDRILRNYGHAIRGADNRVNNQGLLLPLRDRGLDFLGVKGPEVYDFILHLFYPSKIFFKKSVTAKVCIQNKALSQISLSLTRMNWSTMALWNVDIKKIMNTSSFQEVSREIPICQRGPLWIDSHLIKAVRVSKMTEARRKAFESLVNLFSSVTIDKFEIDRIEDLQYLRKSPHISINKLTYPASLTITFKDFPNLNFLHIYNFLPKAKIPDSLEKSDQTLFYENCPKLTLIYPCFIKITAWHNAGWGKKLWLIGHNNASSTSSLSQQYVPLYNWHTAHPMHCDESDKWTIRLNAIGRIGTFHFKILLEENGWFRWLKGPNRKVQDNGLIIFTNDVHVYNIEFEEEAYPKSNFFIG